MTDTKQTIAICCGGDSSEHEVSLRSAEGIYGFFNKERYDVFIVVMRHADWHVRLDNGATAAIDKNDFSFTHNATKRHFNYAYITIHGTPGENGVLQGYFDLIGLPYSTSGVLVEALTFNKFALNNYLRTFGVRVPDSLLVRKGDEERVDPEEVARRIGMPCFVKPAADGSSFGVSKVKSPSQLAAAIAVAMNECDEVMVEQMASGTEISIGCYKTRTKSVVLPATEVVTDREFFDYEAKYGGHTREITPARLADSTAARVAELTSRIYDLLHCNGLIRIDYIISHTTADDGTVADTINLIEINTTPGMTATSFIPQQVKAAGLAMADVLSDIVDNQLAPAANTTAH